MNRLNVFSATMIDELIDFATNQLKKSLGQSEVAVLYIFLVRIANFLVDRKRRLDTKTLPRKIFELEQKIVDADTTETFIYNIYLRERERFYVSFATETLKYQE